jgi:hypothetical protein
MYPYPRIQAIAPSTLLAILGFVAIIYSAGFFGQAKNSSQYAMLGVALIVIAFYFHSPTTRFGIYNNSEAGYRSLPGAYFSDKRMPTL